MAAIAAGLPDIEAYWKYTSWDTQTATRATYVHSIYRTSTFLNGDMTLTDGHIRFMASRESSVYKSGCNTVQPPAISLIPQLKY